MGIVISCSGDAIDGRTAQKQTDIPLEVYQEVYPERELKPICYPDGDKDGFSVKGGSPFLMEEIGPCLSGYAVPPEYNGKIVFDCNDANPLVYPGAKEECNGADDDCNGKIDEGLPSIDCYMPCGKGKMACSKGDWGDCSAPLPTEEICNCKDDDCDGETDELPPNHLVYCHTGEVREEEICIDCKWEHQSYGCQTRWICIDQEIGVLTETGRFTAREPTEGDKMKSCISQWCCKDKEGYNWGCENGQEYIKKTCSCITTVSEFSKEGGAYSPEASFYFESGACPQHNPCDKETLIKVTFANQEKSPLEAWINSYYYGQLPTRKTILSPKKSYVYFIDESLMPKEGAEIELCTSWGCSERIYWGCGEKSQLRVDSAPGLSVGYDETGEPFYFHQKPQSQCDLETAVEITFSNHKTLDLQVWINSTYGNLKPEEEIILEPGGSYTFHLDNFMVPQEGAIIRLCTSSYGCSGEIPLSCGDKREFRVDWVFGKKEQEE